MLTIVPNESVRNLDRLRVAAAHLTAAIAHLNNEAQSRVPVLPDDDSTAADTLRLMVRALTDIVDAVEGIRADLPRRTLSRPRIRPVHGIQPERSLTFAKRPCTRRLPEPRIC